MSGKNNDIAESIIHCEGLVFALASKVGKEGDLREARDLLKARLVKELMAAELRGGGREPTGAIGHVSHSGGCP